MCLRSPARQREAQWSVCCQYCVTGAPPPLPPAHRRPLQHTGPASSQPSPLFTATTGHRLYINWKHNVPTVEFLFVHSFFCRKTRMACIFLLSGKKVNGQIRTLLYNTKAMKTKTKWKKIPFSQTGLATVGFMSTLAVEQIPSDLDFPDCKYCKTHELP